MQNAIIGIVCVVIGGTLGYAFADTLGIIGGGLIGAAAGFAVAAARQQGRGSV